MILGAQLFGICANSPFSTEETLQKIRDIGYEYVEPCVALDPIPGIEKAIWPVDTFRALMPKIREMGLGVESVHIFAPHLNARTDELVALAKEFDLKYFVVKTPQKMDERSLQQASIEYLTVADALAEVGAKLLIHNESADIETRIDGKTAYETLLDLCQNRVFAQVDVGWAYYGGEDVKDLLKRNQYRVAAIHYKDFNTDKEPVVIGRGALDLDSCFQFARAYGLPHIVDQDSFKGDLFEEMTQVYRAVNWLGQSRDGSTSYLNVLDITTGEIRTLASFDRVIEAPNWLKKTNELVYNSNGLLYAYSLETGEERKIETGECDNCNNDHVLAPDESAVAVSHMPDVAEGFASYIYTIPFDTGVATRITPLSPSFLHGWSPDGKELAYCAFRGPEVDIYTIPAEGGEEVRLTGGGFNDGPEYSPDGEYIWFNSTRSGLMQIWRMKRDGSEQTQMTTNERNNWFAHVSPDGQKVVYLSYRKGDLEPGEHLPNMQVELWLMNSDGSDKQRLVSFFGGQGSINVNSWSADSRCLAFVSYKMK